ncbi:hypothetical protein [Nitrospira sp. M1]
MTEESSSKLAKLRDRSKELIKECGLNWTHAHGIAWLEERIKLWPTDWGKDLIILIYGDFAPLKEPLDLPSLGIQVSNRREEGSAIRGANTVHKATVKVEGKNVSSLIEAARRINTFLGSFTLVEWGNSSCGWWSWVTHGSGGVIVTNLAHEDLHKAVEGVLSLSEEARPRVDAALFWIREPRNLLQNSYRSDTLRIYSAYWNAFECLVEAVEIIKPQQKLSRIEKQAALDNILLREYGGKVTPAYIQRAYKEIVDPGLPTKAAHALEVCFGSSASHYIYECFRRPDETNRLYNIRNAINHGMVDDENPDELLRVESRLSKLWIIIWRMFACLIPFPGPIDNEVDNSQHHG